MSSTKKKQLVSTAPVDPRFATAQNVANYCFTSYNEWLSCAKTLGFKDDECVDLKETAYAICPMDWINEWNELRQEGRFYGLNFYDEEQESGGDEDDE